LGNAKSEMKVFRVDTFAYVIFGFVPVMALLAGIGLYAEDQIALSILFIGTGIWAFIYFCFQKLTFESDTMSFHRPFFRDQNISLRNISRATIVLTGKAGRPEWKCLIMAGDSVMLRFNPKPYPLSAIDYMMEQIRAYSPNCIIEDGTKALRRK
jgi:hypothetical protein